MGDGPGKYEYNFTHAKRGVAHIFVNKFFDSEDVPNRKGAEEDEILYKDCFKRLGFELKIHTDYNVDQILDALWTYADGDHSDEDAVVFAFSTHGDQSALKEHKDMPPGLAADIIYGRDGVINISNLTYFLTDQRCPSMVNKPRLFFFQACRGYNLAETLETSLAGVTLVSDKKRRSSNTRPVDIPLQKDFFMAFSTPPGYSSFRRSSGVRCGSWFVRALYDVIRERAGSDVDLLELMTALNRRMMQCVSDTDNPIQDGRMTVPWVASMLTKNVRFTVGSA